MSTAARTLLSDSDMNELLDQMRNVIVRMRQREGLDKEVVDLEMIHGKMKLYNDRLYRMEQTSKQRLRKHYGVNGLN